MIYKERYKVELEDIGRENKIDNKRIVTIMEDIAGSHSDKVGLGVSASAINKKACSTNSPRLKNTGIIVKCMMKWVNLLTV